MSDPKQEIYNPFAHVKQVTPINKSTNNSSPPSWSQPPAPVIQKNTSYNPPVSSPPTYSSYNSYTSYPNNTSTVPTTHPRSSSSGKVAFGLISIIAIIGLILFFALRSDGTQMSDSMQMPTVFHGTWTAQGTVNDQAVTRTIIISADRISFIQNSTETLVISNPTWTAINNSDTRRHGDFPRGFRITGNNTGSWSSSPEFSPIFLFMHRNDNNRIHMYRSNSNSQAQENNSWMNNGFNRANTNRQPASTPAPPPVLARMFVSSNGLNMRSSRSSVNNNNVIRVLSLNTQVDIIARNVNGTGWHRIRHNNTTGYVAASFLSNQRTTIPSTPTGLQANNITRNTANLSWNAVSGATEYHIYEWTNGSWNRIGSRVTTSTNISGMRPNTEHFFNIRASNGAGTSAASQWISIRTRP